MEPEGNSTFASEFEGGNPPKGGMLAGCVGIRETEPEFPFTFMKPLLSPKLCPPPIIGFDEEVSLDMGGGNDCLLKGN